MLGRKLRERRKSKSMTIAELADASGVTNGYISQIEQGKLEPSIEVLHKLASVLDISVSSLLHKSALEPVVLLRENRLTCGTPDGGMLELISPLLGRDGAALGAEVSRVVMPGVTPDTASPVCYEWEACYYMVAGSMEIRMDGDCMRLNSGDSAFVQKNVRHLRANPFEDDAVFISVMRRPE